MPDIHAKLCSPSGAEGWFACPGRIVMEAPFPDNGNEYSNDGTARHTVVAECLNSHGQQNCTDVVGFYVRLVDGTIFMPNVGDDLAGCVQYRDEWVDEDQDYVDTVRALAEGGELHVEQQVNFERFTDVKGDSFGTADAVILKPMPAEGAHQPHELIVIDRKTGYHEVDVERNKQLMLYALGAYDEHSLVYDISRVRLIIHQRGAREWDCSIDDLLKFAGEARSRAITVQNAVAMHGKVDQAEWERTFLNQQPTEDACRYCKAMATCPSMQRHVQDVIGTDFERLTPAYVANAETHPDVLAEVMAAAGLIEDFCKSVRAETERRLLAGKPVPGFKLVLGKAGNRAWTDAADAEKQLKAMRLKVEEMYDLKLISPTSAEKLAKAKVIGPRQWPKLQTLIGRADPKPSVAPADDKRDAWVPPNVADDFTTVADQTADLA